MYANVGTGQITLVFVLILPSAISDKYLQNIEFGFLGYSVNILMKQNFSLQEFHLVIHLLHPIKVLWQKVRVSCVPVLYNKLEL